MTIQFSDGEINLETKIKLNTHSINKALSSLEIDGIAAGLADMVSHALRDYTLRKSHPYPVDMDIYINTDENEEV